MHRSLLVLTTGYLVDKLSKSNTGSVNRGLNYVIFRLIENE